MRPRHRNRLWGTHLIPMHFLLPIGNGVNASFLMATPFSSSHRSGFHSSGWGYAVSERCIGYSVVLRSDGCLDLPSAIYHVKRSEKTYSSRYKYTLNYSVTSLQRLQASESSWTMKQLLDDPLGYNDHIRRYSTGVILLSVFGVRGLHFEDPQTQRLYYVQD